MDGWAKRGASERGDMCQRGDSQIRGEGTIAKIDWRTKTKTSQMF